MADPQSVWNEVMQFLGLSDKSKAHKLPQKPRPLKPMNRDEADHAQSQMANFAVAQALSKPGAMILDAPVTRARSEAEMMAEFERRGVTQRPGITIQQSELPSGTLVERSSGKRQQRAKAQKR